MPLIIGGKEGEAGREDADCGEIDNDHLVVVVNDEVPVEYVGKAENKRLSAKINGSLPVPWQRSSKELIGQLIFEVMNDEKGCA